MRNPSVKFGADATGPYINTVSLDSGTIVFRSLSEVEVDSIIARFAPFIGTIFNKYLLYNLDADAFRIPQASMVAAALELGEAFQEILPVTIAHGTTFGVAEDGAVDCIRKWPAGLALSLFLLIVEPTIEMFGWQTLVWKIAAAAGPHSTLPEFVTPMIRKRLAAAASAAQPAPTENRKARRRARRK